MQLVCLECIIRVYGIDFFMLEKIKPYFDELIPNIESIAREIDKAAIHVAQVAPLMKSGKFGDFAVDVFYTPTPDKSKGHEHYFMLFVRNKKIYISSATFIEKMMFTGIYDSDDNILFPRFQHDFRYTKDEKNFVDGSWWNCESIPYHMEYYRVGGELTTAPVALIIRDGVWQIISK